MVLEISAILLGCGFKNRFHYIKYPLPLRHEATVFFYLIVDNALLESNCMDRGVV